MPESTWGLDGRLALVTGGTGGIGGAVVERLLDAGAFVAVPSRSAKRSQRVAARMPRSRRARFLAIEGDIASPVSVRAMMHEAEAWADRRLTALANVAGHAVEPGLWERPLHKFSPEEVIDGFEKVHRADLVASRVCTWRALRSMRAQRDGRIVYFSSTPALSGYKGTPYTEAKAGLLGLMRDVAREYGPFGIRANAVAPGNIRTKWLDQVPAKERRRLERENPLQRFGEPEEVADLVLFLLSSRSAFVTGQTIVIDGGTVSH